MAFLVITHPEFQQIDFDWIQGYRRQNDKQFDLVDPHFTLVFAIHDLNKGSILSEIKENVEGSKPFDFDLKVATINRDISGSYYHEFLVPDTGYSDIVKLHDKLYSGLLASYQRFDVDFIPHISIGDSEVADISKKRIDELNALGVSIHGRISGLDVIEYGDGAIKVIEKLTL